MADPAEPAPHRGRARKRSDTDDPRRSRSRALKILFQADVRGELPSVTLGRIEGDPDAWAILDDKDEPAVTRVPKLDEFTRTLVDGVSTHRDELDALIGRFARRWSVGRMPIVDRNLLRLGAYELKYESTAAPVVLNEVIELAKALSTEDSGRYVNGVLDAVRRHIAGEQPSDASSQRADEGDDTA